MPKYCVKKPFTVMVAVIMVLVLGLISFQNMTTDLLPAIELPNVVVATVYPGASPERVEAGVTTVLEAGLGTVNGVSRVSSVSKENMSMVALEFENGTNMDSAMVKLSTAVDQVKSYLPEQAGTPMLMQITPDMMPIVMASVDMEGKDIYELSQFTEETLVPYLERQAGVASVKTTGLVKKTVKVHLDQKKIDEINTRVLAGVDSGLADARKELEEARHKVEDGRSELKQGKEELAKRQGELSWQLAQGSTELDSASAKLNAMIAESDSLTAEKQMVSAAKQKPLLDSMMPMMAKAALPKKQAEHMAAAGIPADAAASYINAKVTGNSEVCTALEAQYPKIAASFQQAVLQVHAPTDAATAVEWVASLTAEELAPILSQMPPQSGFTGKSGADLAAMYAQVKNLWDSYGSDAAVDSRAEEIDQRLKVLEISRSQLEEALKAIKENQVKLEAGKLEAAAGFGSGSAQMAAAEASLKTAEEQLKSAQKQFEDARENALENADMSQLLSKEMLANVLLAQNFAMPAGYIKESEDQYLLRVGDAFDSVEQLSDMLLMHMDAGDVGDLRLSDVATVTVVDNAGETYAKVDGNQAVMFSVSKSSTAGTSAVSKEINKAIAELEAKNPGLHIVPLMDQGAYIKIIVDSVLSNLAWGAVLAILVLALFLKSMRPTLVVAFSIPLSLMFTVVLMYFSGITLNVISLSGLAMGVGMLVDNSIVVVENIYRLRSLGLSAAKAAVQGARQVAGAIASSTLTTVCVFLPIVFTQGLTRQLFTDMGLTIAYSLCASLIVALTVVPSMSATLLRGAQERPHPWFDALVGLYEKLLQLCLRFKVVPLVGAVALLAVAIWQTGRMGMSLMPGMGGNQMGVMVTAPEESTQDQAYQLADEVMERIRALDGVETVGAMSAGEEGSNQFSYYVLLDEDASRDNSKTKAAILEATKDLEATVSVSTSNMDMSALGGSGMELTIRGRDLDTLVDLSEDMMELLGQVEGFENISNGQEEGDAELRLIIDKDVAMRCGITVAQIYGELSEALTTEKTATTLTVGSQDYEVIVVDETHQLNRENLMNFKFSATSTNEEGKQITEEHSLSEFARLVEDQSVAAVNRQDQTRYIAVTASPAEGYNTALLARQVQTLLDEYEMPEGYTVQIAGETEQITQAMADLIQMILLAVTFIYLIMVAQFQSLLSPLIVMFTMPLAFTGGLLALLLAGETLSVISMLGFLVLAGVVVNNGIVFVDYTNQLRLEGMEKRQALLAAGRARIRPILMTALTTILAMVTMVFSTQAGAAMARPMAIVSIGGLAYATLLTLFIVPVLYDLLFRRKLKTVDVEDTDALAPARH